MVRLPIHHACTAVRAMVPQFACFRFLFERGNKPASHGRDQAGAQPRGLRAQRGVAEGRAGRIDRAMRWSQPPPVFLVDQDRRIRLIEESPKLHNKRILDPRLDIALEKDKAPCPFGADEIALRDPISNPDTARD